MTVYTLLMFMFRLPNPSVQNVAFNVLLPVCLTSLLKHLFKNLASKHSTAQTFDQTMTKQSPHIYIIHLLPTHVYIHLHMLNSLET
jgi:hypothetical protein